MENENNDNREKYTNGKYEVIDEEKGEITNLEFLYGSMKNDDYQHVDGLQSEESSYHTAYDPILNTHSYLLDENDLEVKRSYGGVYVNDEDSINTADEDAILFGEEKQKEREFNNHYPSKQSHDEESGTSSKFSRFNFPFIKTDPNQGHKANEIKIFSFARPHMRGFHGSWMCFFVAFFLWFSIAPLLPIIQDSLNLTQSDIWLSNICSVTGTVIMRFLLGPLCDKYGAKTMMTRLIAICVIPCALTGTARNLTTLCILRFLISFIGGTFVTGQYWAACMFTKSVVGTAMAISGGWGVVGSGAANIMMGSVIFPFCKQLTGGDEDMAWRISFVFPSILALLTALYFFEYSDDCPYGNYKDIKKAGLMEERSAVDSFRSGALNFNSWILFMQYGACFGVELTMENGTAMYLHDRFGLTVENAAAYASIFGLTNLFSRGLGGYISDICNRSMSLRGRLIAHIICMTLEGFLILAFGRCETLYSTIIVMVFFSTLTQMAMGTAFGIVPYVDGPNTGSIAGIVGAGGNVGAIIIGNVFRKNTYSYSFDYMGVYALVMASLTILIQIKGYKGLVFGEERRQQTLLVPIS